MTVDTRRDTVDAKALAEHRRRPFPEARLGTHVFKRFRKVAYAVCAECGMVRLNNATTRACERFGCWQAP